MALLPEQTYVATSTLVKPQLYEPYKHSVELPIPYDKPAFVSKCRLMHIMGTTFFKYPYHACGARNTGGV
jgi:hypothetical protein